MRNLNFFRRSAMVSEGSTLALTVGSPSAHRRYSALKYLTFMLLFLLGSLNVWGADAEVDDVLWAETWTGAESGTSGTDNTKASANCSTSKGTTMWGGASVTYAESANTVYVRNDALAKGTAPELMFTSGQTWTISGIPTGNATEMTLTFKNNNNKASVTCTTTDVTCTGSITGNSTSGYVGTFTIDNSEAKASTITLQFSNSGNTRLDDIQLVVKTAAAGGGDIIVKTLKSIAVADMTTSYEQGDAFSFDGTCTATYSVTKNSDPQPDENKVVTPTSVTSPDMTTTGDKTITVSYTEGEGASAITKTTEYEINVAAASGDKLTRETTGISNGGGYGSWADKAGVSGAVYAGNSAGGNDAIQLRKSSGTQDESGIISTTSGGYIRTVKVTWNSNTAASRTINIYGKNTAFSSVDELYDSETAGTLLGTIVNGTSTQLTISEDYEYVGIVSSSGALYLDKIVFVWEEKITPAVAKPTISGDENFVGSTSVSISHADADAIYYTTDGSDPKTSVTKLTYSAPFIVNADGTTTVKAYAVKGSDESQVAEATFTKATIMTVSEAKTAIAAAGSTPIENQYVTGIISQIDSYDGIHHSITYWISADGTTTNQLEVYSGKGLNGANFAGLSDLSLGDEVIVKGTLKNYKGTDEFDMNSQIIQLNRTIAAPTFTPNGGGFLTTLNVALASATEGAEVRYTVDDTEPTSTSELYENPIELSATTTIKAAAFKDEFVSVIVSRTFTKGTKITVAEALAALDSSDPIENQFVYGKVSTAPTSNPSSGRLTYSISDDGTATNQLKVYNGYGLNGASFAEKTDLQVGDEVTIFGTLKIYNEEKEFDGGNYLLEFNRPVIPTYSITYVENGANEDIEDVAEATNLPDPLPTVTKNEKIFGGWFTDSEFNTPAVAGAALTANVTLYAKWNDLSPWASVYSSNVTISSDDNNKQVTIGNVDYEPVAKTNKGSSATITLPQGVTTIHLHLVAWNGEAQTVTISGNCFNEEKNLAIDANANVAGTAAKYDLGASGVAYYFSLTPDKAVSAGDEITISAASNKRFILFGVNQEGGVVPELQSIAISGDLTNKSGYKAGDALDMTGLTVMATYTLGGTPQTPVDITEDAALAWSYDPLVENQTSVTITATYKGQTDDITINDLESVASADPLIITNPTTYLNWGTIIKDATAPTKTITVALQNVTAATAALGGTNPTAFTIDDTEIADGDVITVSVASTATEGTYSAKVILTDNAGLAPNKEINLSLTIEDAETPVLTTSKWVVATDADLVDGAEVLITGVKDEVTYAMAASSSNGNNRTAVAGTLNEGVFTPGEGTMAFILVAQEEGKFALRTSNGKYLYAASSTSNYLKTRAAVENGDAKWTLSAISAVANGDNTHKMMQFNGNSTIFACYTTETTTQSDIQLYVPQSVTPPTPVYEDVRTGLTPGNYYTICYNKTMKSIQGASLWLFTSRDANFAYLEEATAPFAAGKPYILYAESDKLEAELEDDEVTNAGTNGALHGTFVKLVQENFDAPGAQIYLVIGNQLRLVTGRTGNTLPAYRAYVELSEIPNTGAPSSMPGRKVRSMPMQGQTATGVDELNASETPVKMLINGQLFILRGEKMYNANGQLVK